MSNLTKNLLIALGITVVLGMLYMTLGGDSTDVAIVDGTTAMTDPALLQKTAQIVADTQKLGTYTIDDTIIDDVRVISLQSIEVLIPDAPTGRTNPFKPVE